MSGTAKANDKETQDKSQQTGLSKSDNMTMLNVQPLPQGRPIAKNVSDDTEELMGYLD